MSSLLHICAWGKGGGRYNNDADLPPNQVKSQLCIKNDSHHIPSTHLKAPVELLQELNRYVESCSDSSRANVGPNGISPLQTSRKTLLLQIYIITNFFSIISYLYCIIPHILLSLVGYIKATMNALCLKTPAPRLVPISFMSLASSSRLTMNVFRLKTPAPRLSSLSFPRFRPFHSLPSRDSNLYTTLPSRRPELPTAFRSFLNSPTRYSKSYTTTTPPRSPDWGILSKRKISRLVSCFNIAPALPRALT